MLNFGSCTANIVCVELVPEQVGAERDAKPGSLPW